MFVFRDDQIEVFAAFGSQEFRIDVKIAGARYDIGKQEVPLLAEGAEIHFRPFHSEYAHSLRLGILATACKLW